MTDTPVTIAEHAERLLKAGEPLAALDLVTPGLERHPGDVRLRQLLGLALTRGGAPARANAVLQALHDEGHDDEETLGLLGASWKSLWRQAAGAERQRCLENAVRCYVRAHAKPSAGVPPENHGWAGINAAALALLAGDATHARGLARDVRTFCADTLRRVAPGESGRYWLLAAAAEAALVCGEINQAEESYAAARAEAGRRFADIGTTRRQARLLLEHLGQDPARLDGCLALPRVVTFAGHMMDRPGRRTPRFPPSLEPAVREAIVAALRRLDAGIGYASAANGGDILFLEAMRDRSAEIRVVLPYTAAEFRKHSVDVVDGRWGARFDALLAGADGVVVVTEQQSAGAPATYDYGNMLLEGLAAMRARQLETPVTLLALWDGREGDGRGGTETIVRRWQALGRDAQIIDIAALLCAAGPGIVAGPAQAPTPEAVPAPPGVDDDGGKQVVAILFADAVGFSRMTEEEVPRFVSEFLGAIGELLKRSPHAPVLRNTWGDGLYFVFADVASAGRFALDLRDVIDGIRWPERGLPDHLGLRIALHAGPVYRCIDPVVGHVNYIGSHVSRAARMEPITPPGQVYASESFVAIAAAYGVTDLEWDYVGQVPLAKRYGTAPMYHLRRTAISRP